jgi:DNA-binding CsgD family transcriptional regulator
MAVPVMSLDRREDRRRRGDAENSNSGGGGMTTLTPLQQRRETVLDLYAKGRTPAEIAGEVDATAKTVREIIGHARRSNDERTVQTRIRPEAFAWTDEKLRTALAMSSVGSTAREISEAIGSTRRTS